MMNIGTLTVGSVLLVVGLVLVVRDHSALQHLMAEGQFSIADHSAMMIGLALIGFGAGMALITVIMQ